MGHRILQTFLWKSILVITLQNKFPLGGNDFQATYPDTVLCDGLFFITLYLSFSRKGKKDF